MSRSATLLGYLGGFLLLFLVWHLAATVLVHSALFPPPWPVLLRGRELIEDNILHEQIIASAWSPLPATPESAKYVAGKVKDIAESGEVRIESPVVSTTTIGTL